MTAAGPAVVPPLLRCLGLAVTWQLRALEWCIRVLQRNRASGMCVSPSSPSFHIAISTEKTIYFKELAQ